jgi:hypothetical protein
LFSLHIHCTSIILTASEKRGERVRETEKGIVLVIPLIFWYPLLPPRVVTM